MYIYVYVSLYIYICKHICIHMCIHICTLNMYVYVYMYVHVCLYIHVVSPYTKHIYICTDIIKKLSSEQPPNQSQNIASLTPRQSCRRSSETLESMALSPEMSEEKSHLLICWMLYIYIYVYARLQWCRDETSRNYSS